MVSDVLGTSRKDRSIRNPVLATENSYEKKKLRIFLFDPQYNASISLEITIKTNLCEKDAVHKDVKFYNLLKWASTSSFVNVPFCNV